MVFGPQPWDNDRNAYFPSIRDAVASGNWTLAQLTVDRVATIMVAAAGNLGA